MGICGRSFLARFPLNRRFSTKTRIKNCLRGNAATLTTGKETNSFHKENTNSDPAALFLVDFFAFFAQLAL